MSDETETAAGEGGSEDTAASEPRRESFGVVLVSAVLVFLLGLWLAVSLPVSDPSYTNPTDAGSQRQVAAPNLATPESHGRKVYVREGCYSCHTQQVRAIEADAYLGPVSVPGDYAYDEPEMLGTVRVGPDLTHFAGRDGTKDPAALAAHLKSPRATVSWSVMPSYSSLSDQDMNDLISYLSTLK